MAHQVPTEGRRWSFPDPWKATGTEDEQLGVYRRVRDAIREQIGDRFLGSVGGIGGSLSVPLT
jgi:hypothetical protein